MPTFRVTCATPGAYFSQLIIEASDGIDAKDIAEKALCQTATVVLVQAVPTDLSPSHLKAIEAILNSHTKPINHIARKAFGHWVHSLNTMAAIILAFLVLGAIATFLGLMATASRVS